MTEIIGATTPNVIHRFALTELKLAAFVAQEGVLVWDSSDKYYEYIAKPSEPTEDGTLQLHNLNLSKFQDVMNDWKVTRLATGLNHLGQISIKRYTLSDDPEQPIRVTAWSAAAINYQSDSPGLESVQLERDERLTATRANRPPDMHDDAELENALFDLRVALDPNKT